MAVAPPDLQLLDRVQEQLVRKFLRILERHARSQREGFIESESH